MERNGWKKLVSRKIMVVTFAVGVLVNGAVLGIVNRAEGMEDQKLVLPRRLKMIEVEIPEETSAHEFE